MKTLVLVQLCFAACALGDDFKAFLGVAKVGLEGVKGNFPYGVFGSRVDYDPSPTFSDDNVIMIAKQAFQEMEKIWETDHIDPKWQPKVMTALLVDDQIYLSSSAKFGKYAFSLKLADQRVQASLQRCFIATSDDFGTDGNGKILDHNTGGKCGEQLAAHFFYTGNPDADLSKRADDKKARIVTVERRSDVDKICVKDPCAATLNDQSQFLTYGCDAFTQAQKFNVILPANNVDELCKDRDVSKQMPESTAGFTFVSKGKVSEPSSKPDPSVQPPRRSRRSRLLRRRGIPLYRQQPVYA